LVHAGEKVLRNVVDFDPENALIFSFNWNLQD
jgi:hypothetical protein